MIDDVSDFENVFKALTDIGFSENEKQCLFKTLAAILHLGNIEFVEKANDLKGK